MDAPSTAIFYSLVHVAAALLIGWRLFESIKPKEKAKTQAETGRLWLAWVVMTVCVTMLPKVFEFPDIDHFLKFLINLFFYGLVAFCVGWGYMQLTLGNETKNSNQEIKRLKKIRDDLLKEKGRVSHALPSSVQSGTPEKENNMPHPQQTVLKVTGAIVTAMLIYPPWGFHSPNGGYYSKGYSLIFLPPEPVAATINSAQLLTQVAIVLVIGAIAYFYFKNEENS